jgi:hypothetical protein
MSHGHGHGEAEGASEESVVAGYELKDTNPRPLVFATVGVFVLLFLSFALIGGLLFVTGGQPGDLSNSLLETPEQLPPEPRLEQNPNIDGDRIVSEAARLLESYGPVTGAEGRAHIPINRSMELLLEQGITPFGAPPAQGGAQGQAQGSAPATSATPAAATAAP